VTKVKKNPAEDQGRNLKGGRAAHRRDAGVLKRHTLRGQGGLRRQEKRGVEKIV